MIYMLIPADIAETSSTFPLEYMSHQQREANLLVWYGLHHAMFCCRHDAREVSSVAGFLLGWIAWRQKLIFDSTEINDFTLTCLLVQQWLCAFLGGQHHKQMRPSLIIWTIKVCDNRDFPENRNFSKCTSEKAATSVATQKERITP